MSLSSRASGLQVVGRERARVADEAEKGATWAALKAVCPQGPRVTSPVSVLPQASPVPAAALLAQSFIFTPSFLGFTHVLCIEDCLSQHRCLSTACSQVAIGICGPVG